MARARWLASAGLCILALWIDPAYGCRYNVREVGFIDVGIDPYRLFVHVPETVSPGEAAGLKDTLDVTLADTNIRCEPVTRGADANHPASPGGEGVLVSPDGQSKRFVLPADEQSLSSALLSMLEAVLESPTRRQILEKAAGSYGVVLLIEGPEPDRNAAAREAGSAAITQIGEQLEYLPKPIAKGPEIVVLDRASLAREEMLLWTLGLEPQDVNEPHVAIFYSRGRWIGPVFKGHMLAGENLAKVLSVIGADCECGLDHRWLQGTMLPARWDERLAQKATESLGFDPESPMVKMEMVSIVRRGMGGFDDPGVPFAYSEMEVGGGVADSNEPDGTASLSRSLMVPAQPATVQSVLRASPAHIEGQMPSSQGGLSLAVLAVCFGGMIVLVAVASIVVVWKARKV